MPFGPVFKTIFESNECRFDLSTDYKYLIRIIYKLSDNELVKVEEKKYRRIYKVDNILNSDGGKWTPVNKKKKTINVYERVDRNDFVTGLYGISMLVDENGEKRKRRMYYKRVGE